MTLAATTDTYTEKLHNVSFACAEIVALGPKLTAELIAIESSGCARSLLGVKRHATNAERYAKQIAELAGAVRRGIEGE